MLSVEQVLQHYKMEIHKSFGDELRCLCPFHNDHHPSFDINSTTGIWICRAGCGGGNLIQFVATKEHVDLQTAELLLNNDFSFIVSDRIGHTEEELRQIKIANDTRTENAASQEFIKGFVNTVLGNISRLLLSDPGVINDWMKILVYVKSDKEPHVEDEYYDLYGEFLKDTQLLRKSINA